MATTEPKNWTIAWRKPHANRYQRATNWTGTWHQAVNMSRAFAERNPELQVWYVPTLDAEQTGYVCEEDRGNILGDNGRRVRIVDNGTIDADLVAQTYCECWHGKLGDSMSGMTACPDCDGHGVVPETVTIDEVARELVASNRAPSFDVARDAVTVLAGQVSDDPALWNASAGALTRAGADMVTESYQPDEIETFAVGDRVVYGVAPGRDHTYTVTMVHSIAMVEITRHDARLGRDVVIDVYRDELDHAPAEDERQTINVDRLRGASLNQTVSYPARADDECELGRAYAATAEQTAATVAHARQIAMHGLTDARRTA